MSVTELPLLLTAPTWVPSNTTPQVRAVEG